MKQIKKRIWPTPPLDFWKINIDGAFGQLNLVASFFH
jgi:hypothetical protein